MSCTDHLIGPKFAWAGAQMSSKSHTGRQPAGAAILLADVAVAYTVFTYQDDQNYELANTFHIIRTGERGLFWKLWYMWLGAS